MNFVKISQTITLNERKRLDYLNPRPLDLSPICLKKRATNWTYWLLNFKCQKQTNNHESTKFRKHEKTLTTHLHLSTLIPEKLHNRPCLNDYGGLGVSMIT